jgi:glycosyltransferase involved in cell wall biosynthesis
MTHPQHFLFAMCMVGSVPTVFYNLKQIIAKRPDARSSWLAIETGSSGRMTEAAAWSIGSSWRQSLAAWWHMRGVQRTNGKVDAALVLERGVGASLSSIRRKVPFILSTDMTPLFSARQAPGTLVHRSGTDSFRTRVARAINRKAYLQAYHILPWSTAVRDSLVRDYGIPESRLTVLPPGINLRKWPVPQRSAEDAAHPNRSFTVLHVGSDFMGKGGDLILRLAAEPEFRDVQFHCVTTSVVGATPANVTLHVDLKPNSEPLQALYRQADVLALPARTDTFSIVALEAMASGLPVIVSDVGGNRDIVVDGKTGYLIAPGDLSALRERLMTLQRDPSLRLRFGAEGRKRVECQFDLHRNVETVMKLLNEASRSRNRGMTS